MYELPKAVHFIAYRDGVELAWNDSHGLQKRWKAANLALESGVKNLLLRRPEDFVRMRDAAAAASTDGYQIDVDPIFWKIS